MLTITREGNIITVASDKANWPKTVCYNMEDWTVRLDQGPWLPMDDADRHWVVKHYLHKAKTQEES